MRTGRLPEHIPDGSVGGRPDGIAPMVLAVLGGVLSVIHGLWLFPGAWNSIHVLEKPGFAMFLPLLFVAVMSVIVGVRLIVSNEAKREQRPEIVIVFALASLLLGWISVAIRAWEEADFMPTLILGPPTILLALLVTAHDRRRPRRHDSTGDTSRH